MQPADTAAPSSRGAALAAWGLFVGLALVLGAGGLFSTLLSVRAELNDLPTWVSAALTAAYYLGFLLGTKAVLRAIGLVGHIRVFAALCATLAAMVVFLGVTLIGLFKHGLHFFSLFFPHGAPLFTAPILIPIELVSYLSRPISLSVRLFANMTVGHVLLKVLAGFVVALGIFGVVPLVVLVAITALELLVAVLQAYIFMVLPVVYISMAEEHH